MEIINSNAATLSNYEVLSLLQDLKGPDERGRRKISHAQQHLATIAYETSKYLEETPCKYQNPEIIQNFLRALQPFKLTKAEKLMLLNHRPQTPVEIQLMVEESEERLTDEQVEELLQVVSQYLPGDPTSDEWDGATAADT